MMSTPDIFLTASKLCDISNKVSKIKTDICDKLSIKDISNFNKVTQKSMADCGPLKKNIIAHHLLHLLAIFEPLSEYSIKLQQSGNFDINHIDQVVSKCISKECNDVSNSNEFNINAVRGDIKKLDGLVNELKTSISMPAPPSSPAIPNLLSSYSEVLENHQSQMDSIVHRLDTLLVEKTNYNFNTFTTTPNIENISPATVPKPSVSASNPTKHIEKYAPDFISQQDESDLCNFLDNQTFKTINSGWSVLSFGETYQYTGSPKPQNTDPVPIPDLIKNVMKEINNVFKNCDINQCTVNKYTDSSIILPEHSDNERTIKPESNIFTVTLGSQRDITFRDVATGNERVVTPDSRSLYVMSQPSQFLWTHRMDAGDPKDIKHHVRYSLTFRCVGSNYSNSTIILGDSNTKHLAFGTGSGSFGQRLPGKRIQALIIEDIDPTSCIGYKNIVIHVGINNLKSTKIPVLYGDTKNINVYNKFILLKDKIDYINSLCPQSNIVVSPILPTKIDWLNQRALEFNKYLFEYLCIVNIRSIDFDDFLDSYWDKLDDSYGCYNSNDKIHLGRSGIRKLAKLIKDSILNPGRDGRSYASVTCDESGRGAYVSS